MRRSRLNIDESTPPRRHGRRNPHEVSVAPWFTLPIDDGMATRHRARDRRRVGSTGGVSGVHVAGSGLAAVMRRPRSSGAVRHGSSLLSGDSDGGSVQAARGGRGSPGLPKAAGQQYFDVSQQASGAASYGFGASYGSLAQESLAPSYLSADDALAPAGDSLTAPPWLKHAGQPGSGWLPGSPPSAGGGGGANGTGVFTRGRANPTAALKSHRATDGDLPQYGSLQFRDLSTPPSGPTGVVHFGQLPATPMSAAPGADRDGLLGLLGGSLRPGLAASAPALRARVAAETAAAAGEGADDPSPREPLAHVPGRVAAEEPEEDLEMLWQPTGLPSALQQYVTELDEAGDIKDRPVSEIGALLGTPGKSPKTLSREAAAGANRALASRAARRRPGRLAGDGGAASFSPMRAASARGRRRRPLARPEPEPLARDFIYTSGRGFAPLGLLSEPGNAELRPRRGGPVGRPTRRPSLALPNAADDNGPVGELSVRGSPGKLAPSTRSPPAKVQVREGAALTSASAAPPTSPIATGDGPAGGHSSPASATLGAEMTSPGGSSGANSATEAGQERVGVDPDLEELKRVRAEEAAERARVAAERRAALEREAASIPLLPTAHDRNKAHQERLAEHLEALVRERLAPHWDYVVRWFKAKYKVYGPKVPLKQVLKLLEGLAVDPERDGHLEGTDGQPHATPALHPKEIERVIRRLKVVREREMADREAQQSALNAKLRADALQTRESETMSERRRRLYYKGKEDREKSGKKDVRRALRKARNREAEAELAAKLQEEAAAEATRKQEAEEARIKAEAEAKEKADAAAAARAERSRLARQRALAGRSASSASSTDADAATTRVVDNAVAGDGGSAVAADVSASASSDSADADATHEVVMKLPQPPPFVAPSAASLLKDVALDTLVAPYAWFVELFGAPDVRAKPEDGDGSLDDAVDADDVAVLRSRHLDVLCDTGLLGISDLFIDDALDAVLFDGLRLHDECTRIRDECSNIVARAMRVGCGKLAEKKRQQWNEYVDDVSVAFCGWRALWHTEMTLRRCRRPFYVWRRWNRRERYLRELFRCCFWPLRVWFREAQGRMYTRSKIRFLLRVWRTLYKLRVTKRWAKWAKRRAATRQLLDSHLAKKRDARLRFVIGAWRTEAHRSATIMKKWKRSATANLSSYSSSAQLRLYLYCWRYLIWGVQRAKRRAYKYAYPSYAGKNSPYAIWYHKDRLERQRKYAARSKTPESGVARPNVLLRMASGISRPGSRASSAGSSRSLLDSAPASRVTSPVPPAAAAGGAAAGESSGPKASAVASLFGQAAVEDLKAGVHAQQEAAMFGSDSEEEELPPPPTWDHILLPGPCRKPTFPTVDETPWMMECVKLGKARGEDTVSLTEVLAPMHEWLETRERKEVKAMRKVFTRLAPKVIAQLRAYVAHKRKKRYAWFTGLPRCKRRYFELLRANVEEAKATRDMVASLGGNTPEERAEVLRRHLEKQENWVDQAAGKWRQEVEWRKNGIKMAGKLTKAFQRRQEALRLWYMERDSVTLKELESIQQREDAVSEFLKEKTDELQEKVRYATEHAEALRQRRAEFMWDAMHAAFENMSMNRARDLAADLLANLRTRVLQKKSVAMYRRARLRNWLRICARYRYLLRGMEVYHTLRLRARSFFRWRDNLNKTNLLISRGLKQEIRVRASRLSKYSQALAGLGPDAIKLLDETAKGAFARWCEYSQGQTARRRICEAYARLRTARLLRRVFVAIKTGLKPQYTYTGAFGADQELVPLGAGVGGAIGTHVKGGSESEPSIARLRSPDRRRSMTVNVRRVVGLSVSFAELRAARDIDTWQVMFLRPERFMFSNWHRRKNKWVALQLRKRAAKEVKLKNLLAWHMEGVAKRVRLERRLLFTSFLDRTRSTHFDRVGVPVGGAGGTPFQDVVPPLAHVSRVIVYHSTGVNGIGFDYKSGERELPSTFHGSVFGDMSTFDLDDDEYLVGIEAVTQGIVGRLRLYSSHGRRSDWYGRGAVGRPFFQGYLKEYFEAVKKKDPAMSVAIAVPRAYEEPRNAPKARECIIGLVGRATDTNLSAIGCIVRKTVHSELLSNCWVELPADSKALAEKQRAQAEEQFGTLLRMRSCDVQAALVRAHTLARYMTSAAAALREEDDDAEVDAYQGMRGRGGGRMSLANIQRPEEAREIGEPGVVYSKDIILDAATAATEKAAQRAIEEHELEPVDMTFEAPPVQVDPKLLEDEDLGVLAEATGRGPATLASSAASVAGFSAADSAAGAGGAGGDAADTATLYKELQKVFNRPDEGTVRRSKGVPRALRSPFIAFRLMLWFFHGLTRGLVECPSEDDEERGRELLLQGRILRDEGEAMVMQGREVLSAIEGYRESGDHVIDEAALGESEARRVRQQIRDGMRIVREGMEKLERAADMLHDGYKLVPQLPETKGFRLYLESLYKLARSASLLDTAQTDKLIGASSGAAVGSKAALEAAAKEAEAAQMNTVSDALGKQLFGSSMDAAGMLGF